MSVLDDICFQMHGQSEGADGKLLEVSPMVGWPVGGGGGGGGEGGGGGGVADKVIPWNFL